MVAIPTAISNLLSFLSLFTIFEFLPIAPSPPILTLPSIEVEESDE